METQTASVHSTESVSRLRVTRHTTSPPSSNFDSVPRPMEPKHFYPESQTTSEDDSGTLDHAGATSRLLSASLPSQESTHSSGGAHHRLRVLLDRFDTPPRTPASASHVAMPPSPSELESDFDLPPAQAARASIKDLFKNALREPGDTPQKPRPMRRASFNAVGSPKVTKSRRKSTSDEEREVLAKREDERLSDLPTAASWDRLRLQLTESMPSIQSPASSSMTSHPRSGAPAPTPKRSTPTHHLRASKIPLIHSPVKHAKSHQELEPFADVNETDHGDLFSPQRRVAHSSHTSRVQTLHPPLPHANSSPPTIRLQSHDSDLYGSSHRNSSRSVAKHHEHFQRESDIGRERDPDHRHLPSPAPRTRKISTGRLHSSTEENIRRASSGAWPTPQPPGSSPNGRRSPRQPEEGGSADGHSEDGYSSRDMSASSNAEYRDRLKDAEREHQRGLERNWNRPTSVSDPHDQVTDSHSHEARPESALGHSQPRSHSRSGYEHARSASPSSSTSSRSHHEEEPEEQHEIEHERERNWNAAHPKWGQHPHHGPGTGDYGLLASTSPSPPRKSGSEQALGKRHKLDRMSSSTSLSHPPHGHSQFSSQFQLQEDHPRPHSRLDNVHDNSRSGSPSSSTSSRSHQDIEEHEELHERERNWNAHRPKWEPHPRHNHEADHPLAHGLSSHAHDSSVDKEREHNWGRHHPASSLDIPTNGHRPRSVSPAPRSHLQPSSSKSRYAVRSRLPAPPSSPSLRPSSPLPPHTHDKVKGKRKEIDLEREKGWDSPKVPPSHRHERTPSSPSPVASRPESRTSSRTLPSSVIRSHRTSSPTPASNHGIDSKKGHRRTTTELSESMGPFPRQTTLPPSLAAPEESNLSLFADESVPPPQMSTPTFKATHLPDISVLSDASDIPLPPSPPSPRTPIVTRSDADLARLQRAVAPDFAFPARHPSPPAPPLSTPLRRSSFNTPKMEFRTPPPPVGLPELPGPPSSDEEGMNTPVRPNGAANPLTTMSTMKTPRFPGAFGTPAPSVPDSIMASTPEDESLTAGEVETTPKLEPIDRVPASHSRSSDDFGNTPSPVPVPPTPAPPGMYRATPTPAKRKGILKVRFDGDVQTSEGFVNGATGDAVKQNTPSPPPSPSSEDIPPLNLSPSRRKGLRLVDEYGRERRFTEDGEEIMLDSHRKLANVVESPKQPLVADDTTASPRRRAKLRQLDALGNDATVEPEIAGLNGVIPEARGGKKAVFSRLTRSLVELRHDIALEEDALAASVPEGGPRDDERLMELATASKAARVERNKLTRKLQLERHAEGGIAGKRFITHHTRDLSSETSDRGSWWKRKWRLVLVIFILEIILLYMGYRLAMVHAKQLWLSTHFDPFFPALYLHKTRPSFLSRFGTLPVDWSAFAISGAVKRVGVRGFVMGVGQRLWEEIWSWRMEPWEAWGSPAAGPPVPRPWPS